MSNNTTCSQWNNSSVYLGFNSNYRGYNYYGFVCTFTGAIILAVLSPVAILGNALILLAIWKKTLQRTSFHVFLSGLVLTDLLTGLISQPVNVAGILLYTSRSGVPHPRPLLFVTIETIADASATYFIAVTILLLTVMSVERWLHISRRSMVSSLHVSVCLTAIVFVVVPAPVTVLRTLETIRPGSIGRVLYIVNITMMLVCFCITFLAYVKVLRAIRGQQQPVEVLNTSCQRFGQTAITLAKYKKSVITILCIVALFCLCFFPYVISLGVFIRSKFNDGINVVLSVSLVLLFSSSSLSPCLYLWRMNDVRNGVKLLFRC